MSSARTPKGKTAPRRRISRIKRNSSNCHLPCSSSRFFATSFYPVPRIGQNVAHTPLLSRWHGNFLGARCNTPGTARAWQNCSICFCISWIRVRKTTNPPQHFLENESSTMRPRDEKNFRLSCLYVNFCHDPRGMVSLLIFLRSRRFQCSASSKALGTSILHFFQN